MKFLTSLLLLVSTTCFGAVPAYTSFKGTGGIVVSSNPPIGWIIIDGSGISSPTGGVSAASATNIATFVSTSAFTAATTNIVWVSAAGNDATATRNRLDLPAQTMTKAVGLAIYGDTVVTMPNTYYNCSNLWRKSGVNFWLMPGTTLTFTNTATDLGWGIFDDRFSNMAVTSNVAGSGKFLWVGGLPTSDDDVITYMNSAAIGAFVQTNPASRTVVDGQRLTYGGFSGGAGIPAACNFKHGTNTLRLTEGIFDIWFRSNYITFDATLGGNVDISSTTAGCYWESGEQHIYSPVIQGKAYALWPNDALATTKQSEWYVTADLVEGKYYASGTTNRNWKTWVKLGQLNNTNGLSSTGAACELIGGGLHYLSALKINSAKSYALAVGSPAEVWADVQKFGADTQWFTSTGGKTWLRFQSCEDNGNIVDGFDISGGTNFIVGLQAVVTNTAGRIVRHTGGTATYRGIAMTVSGNTNSPVNVRTNGLTLENCTLINASTKFSVTSDVNATNNVKFLGASSTTMPTNKIVVQIGPLTVDANVQ